MGSSTTIHKWVDRSRSKAYPAIMSFKSLPSTCSTRGICPNTIRCICSSKEGEDTLGRWRGMIWHTAVVDAEDVVVDAVDGVDVEEEGMEVVENTTIIIMGRINRGILMVRMVLVARMIRLATMPNSELDLRALVLL
jgi:hypothetical protein